MTITVGVPDDDGINDALKCHITFAMDDSTHVNIVGYIAEGSSLSMDNHYSNPFEEDYIGGQFLNKAGALGQEISDLTLKTQQNSVSIWNGTGFLNGPITLHFVAYTDAKKEVQDPISYLLMLCSPELLSGKFSDLRETASNAIQSGGDSLKGRMPKEAIFDIGRRIKAQLAITNISFNLDAPKVKDGGYFAHNTVQLSVQSTNVINRSSINTVFT
ncbi:TPA: hypothetical protein ACX6RX_003216 [Photobacterium damselae]